MLRRFLSKIIVQTIYLSLRLRYKFIIKGNEHLKDKKLQEKGVLILPNHPTVGFDPIMIKKFVGGSLDIIPLVAEEFHRF